MYPQKQPPQPSTPPHSYYEPQPQYASGIPVADHHQYVPPPVYGQPPQPIPGIPARNLRWSSSLCSCWSDVPNCCLTCWCPCVTFGQIAEIVDKGNTPCVVLGGVYALISILTCCGCLFSCGYRTKIRSQYSLDEAPCNDCLLHFFCELCALCQEYRELKHQGYDLSMGWEGNLQMRNNGVQMPPMPPGGMNR